MKKSKFLLLAVAIILVAAACNKSTPSDTDQTSQTNQNQNSDTANNTPTPTPTPSPTETPTPPPSQTPNPTPNPTPTPAPTPDTVRVSITSSGFSPNSITIKSGTTVIFENKDSKNHWVASNPHPVHTDYPGFDAKHAVAPGDSYSFTFTKVGTWGYHDHLSPSTTGKIIVTQ